IPGGLCKADSCRDDDSICGEGFSCVYSSKQRYVCAKGVADGGFCSCTAVSPGDAEGGEPALALALLGVLGGTLAQRRRRR
ncbi:MAG: MYXO-CTERM sorting domain-containing protein, partial [Myxococcota bacterium]